MEAVLEPPRLGALGSWFSHSIVQLSKSKYEARKVLFSSYGTVHGIVFHLSLRVPHVGRLRSGGVEAVLEDEIYILVDRIAVSRHY